MTIERICSGPRIRRQNSLWWPQHKDLSLPRAYLLLSLPPFNYCFPCMRGSRNFRRGGGGGSRSVSDNVVFFQSSAYYTEFKWSISKNPIIFQGSRGGPTFSRGGGPTFSRGVQLLIPYRNPFNL